MGNGASKEKDETYHNILNGVYTFYNSEELGFTQDNIDLPFEKMQVNRKVEHTSDSIPLADMQVGTITLGGEVVGNITVNPQGICFRIRTEEEGLTIWKLSHLDVATDLANSLHVEGVELKPLNNGGNE